MEKVGIIKKLNWQAITTDLSGILEEEEAEKLGQQQYRATGSEFPREDQVNSDKS